MSDAVTPTELKQLGEDLAATWGHAKTVLDAQELEIKKLGDATGETKQAFDRLNTRLDDIEVKMSRPGTAGGDDTEDGPAAEKAAFGEYIRKGITPDVAKALSRGTDTAGGFLVPEGVAKELIKNLVEVSDVRKLADIKTITEGDSYPYNRRTSEAAAGWTSEQGTRSESTNPAFGKGRIPLHEMFVMVDISRQLLDMAGFDVEAEWMQETTEQCAKLEGAAFCTADGVGKPQGIFSAEGGLQASYTASGAAAALTADALLGMPMDIKSGYLPGAKFAFERATLKLIRQLKDGNGQYLFAAGFGDALKSGVPATVAGFGYELLEDAPAVEANAFAVAFGDFKAGYKIVDHTKVHQIRDEATQAASGNVRFWVTRYVGGQVVNTEAIRLMKIAAS